MPVLTVEVENLLSILPESLDQEQLICELNRMFPQEKIRR